MKIIYDPTVDALTIRLIEERGGAKSSGSMTG
jgi:hypothetical protein